MGRQLHGKKRIEIVVEGALLEPVLDEIDEAGATGYTVLPALTGRGRDGLWEAGGLSQAFTRVLVIVIAAPGIAARLIDALDHILVDYTAIVTVSDVEVLRDDHF
jgi:PII-like signaling protein